MDVHYSQFQTASALPATLFHQTLVPPPPVFSEPISELTCNISGSRKRAREDEPLLQATAASSAMFMYQQQLMLQKQILLQNQTQVCKIQSDVPVENSRLNRSILTSTSGRPTTTQYNVTATTSAGLSSPTSLISLLNQQGLEVDDLVRLNADKLRSALDDSRKRQCRALLSAVAQHAQGRIAEKQAEVEAMEKRNAELQERLRQAAAESQALCNVARNSEVVIASLRHSLEQAVLQKLNRDPEDNCVTKCADSQIEGYGDSEEEAVTVAAASSAAGIPCPGRFADASKPAVSAVAKKPPTSSPTAAGIRFTPCKSCGAANGCVLVLPCRHLCLCQLCEPSADVCPVCDGRKNGSLHINLS